MKTVSATLALSGLILLVGCNPKNESNSQSKNTDTVQTAKKLTVTPEFVQIKTKGTHLVSPQKDSLTIDVIRTAIIVVDMENDFGSKGGMFDRAGIPISDIQKAVAPISDVLTTAKQAG